MKSWKLRSLILCLLLAGLFYSNPSAFGQAKPIELNYSTHFPGPHSVAVLAKEWANEIDKRTNGRVKITVFFGGTLSPADKVYDSVLKGIADIGLGAPSLTRGRFPLTEVILLPLGYKSAKEGTQLANEYFLKFKPKEFEEVQVMYVHCHGPGVLHSKKAVNKFEDLRGMKIRSTGLTAKIAQAVGAAPVAMPVNEAYDALSKGVVEASLAPYEALYGWKWAEVTKFTTVCSGFSYTTVFPLVMNKKKWNALPPDIQKIIEKVNEEWKEKEAKNWDAIDQEGKDFALKLGQKITHLSKEEDEKTAKAVKPLLDDYVKETKGLGLPGDEVLNFLQDRLKQIQK
jgi:TRAP-type C4-dicarboxylate transport system substrate-binding protein